MSAVAFCRFSPEAVFDVALIAVAFVAIYDFVLLFFFVFGWILMFGIHICFVSCIVAVVAGIVFDMR